MEALQLKEFRIEESREIKELKETGQTKDTSDLDSIQSFRSPKTEKKRTRKHSLPPMDINGAIFNFRRKQNFNVI